MHYAGEKFLHSALLLIQSVMIFFAKQATQSFAWGKAHPWFNLSLGELLGVLLTCVSGGAAICWYIGFRALNSRLWKNWERRMDELRAAEGANSGRRAASDRVRLKEPGNATV